MSATGPGGAAASEIRARQLFMIATVADLLAGTGHVAIGSTSPIPAAGALLARRRDPALRVSVLGSERHNAFTDGNRELFDCAAQGRIDAFFLSGGQIDGAGRINLVGIGPYPDVAVRFPGSFGSAFLYPLVPRVILFREVHTRRTLVERVDFVSAAPGSPAAGDRNGGPHALVTGLAAFRFDPDRGRFALATLAPGATASGVAGATGFAYDEASPEPFRAAAGIVAEIDDVVTSELTADYPAFAESWSARDVAA